MKGLVCEKWGVKMFDNEIGQDIILISRMLISCILGIAGPRKKMCKQYLTNLDKAKITGISLTWLVNNIIGFYLLTGYGYAEERPERSWGFCTKTGGNLFSLVLPVLGKTNALNFGVRGRAPIMLSDPHAWSQVDVWLYPSSYNAASTSLWCSVMRDKASSSMNHHSEILPSSLSLCGTVGLSLQ